MTTLRGPGVKSVGKPDAGNRHVRFDERGRETGLAAPRPSSTLPKPARNRPLRGARKKVYCNAPSSPSGMLNAIVNGLLRRNPLRRARHAIVSFGV